MGRKVWLLFELEITTSKKYLCYFANNLVTTARCKIQPHFLSCALKLPTADPTGPRPAGTSQVYLHLKTRCRAQHIGDAAASAYCAVRETDKEQHRCLALLESSGVVLDYTASAEGIWNAEKSPEGVLISSLSVSKPKSW